MRTLYNEVLHYFLKDRLNPFAIIQAVLILPILVYLIFAFSPNDTVNYFYCKLVFFNLALIILIRSIEKFILKQNGYIFLSSPFLFSILFFIVFLPFSIETVFVISFYSIYTFGVPLFLVCLPYALIFKSIKKRLNISGIITTFACLLTILSLAVFIALAGKYYRPVEKRMYFTNQTTEKLKKQSLDIFKQEYGIEGKIKSYDKISHLDQPEESELPYKVRAYVIAVIPKDPTSEKAGYVLDSNHYTFIYKFGRWVLKEGL